MWLIFVKTAFCVDTVEEVQAAFAKQGVDISAEELYAIGDAVSAAVLVVPHHGDGGEGLGAAVSAGRDTGLQRGGSGSGYPHGDQQLCGCIP